MVTLIDLSRYIFPEPIYHGRPFLHSLFIVLAFFVAVTIVVFVVYRLPRNLTWIVHPSLSFILVLIILKIARAFSSDQYVLA